ncbi:type II secretion system F family protein [Ammonifex thiophilus]|uniref:Type II secretion system protein GspF domain-containing protein n=1 Tax=Ammonifex thiophilus TaxID=444093 RepID=A0A3D8P447_9THEO|nr:type II secretion system F family protein [Ammonifex thiophilus]RDV82349.1 hypothetical protein DXX99_08020 [Ammonifex thiophilus]
MGTFSVPFFIPLLAGAAALCFFYALRLKATVTVFDLAGVPEKPLRERAREFAEGLARRHPWLVRLAGAEDPEEKLRAAGYPWGLMADEYRVLKLAALALALVLFLTGVLAKAWFLLLSLLLAKVPDWWLSVLADEKRRKMKREFLEVASKLSVALAAGLNIAPALEWAARGATSETPLRQELGRALDEVKANRPLNEVLEEFARRTGLLDARRLATLVVGAELYGRPVAGALKDAVRDASERRKAEILAQGRDAEGKMLLVLLVMVFPMALLLVAPMLITLAQSGVFGFGGFPGP